jgi:hypothetical protein
MIVSSSLATSLFLPTPEQRARQNIGDLLVQCGWIVQSREEKNLELNAIRRYIQENPYGNSFCQKNGLGTRQPPR